MDDYKDNTETENAELSCSSNREEALKNMEQLLLKQIESFQNLPRLRVLSLFDGIGTGYYALKKLNFDIEAYYSSEIDTDALLLTHLKFPDIIQLGSIIDIDDEMLEKLAPINFLIGSSPSSDLSRSNPRGKGLYGVSGTGILFFDYFRIWSEIHYKNQIEERPFYFFYENIYNMNLETINTISEFLRVDPVLIESYHYNPERQKSLVWSNIPKICDLGIQQTTELLLLHGAESNYPVSSQGMRTDLIVPDVEEMMGFERHYSDFGNLDVPFRQKLLFDSWNVHKIKDIFKLLKKYFI